MIVKFVGTSAEWVWNDQGNQVHIEVKSLLKSHFLVCFVAGFNINSQKQNIVKTHKGAVGIQYSYGLHFLNFGALFIARIVSQSHYLFWFHKIITKLGSQ